MSDNVINTVGRVGLEPSAGYAGSSEPRPVAPSGAGGSPPPASADTRVTFLVDETTAKVTILVVDKASEKVVRTIPNDAIQDIPVGELLHYST